MGATRGTLRCVEAGIRTCQAALLAWHGDTLSRDLAAAAVWWRTCSVEAANLFPGTHAGRTPLARPATNYTAAGAFGGRVTPPGTTPPSSQGLARLIKPVLARRPPRRTAQYKGEPMLTSAGPVTAPSLTGANIS